MIEHISLALKCPVVSGTTKLVLIALCDKANSAGVCWPSRAAIAAIASVHERSVARITAELEKAGLIRVWVDPNGVKTNRYWIDVEAIRKTVPIPSQRDRRLESDAALKEFETECQRSLTVTSHLFTESSPPCAPSPPQVTPMSSGITREPPEEPKTGARSSIAAPDVRPKQGGAPDTPSSTWVRTVWTERYTRRYPGTSPPWTGREAKLAKAIAGSVRDACRTAMSPEASEEAVNRRASERLGAAVDAYLAIKAEEDKYIFSRCHPFSGLADRLPRLMATAPTRKAALGAW